MSNEIITVEDLQPKKMRQVYEREKLEKYMYAYLLNNCKGLENTKFQITRLRLKYSVNVQAPGTLSIISYKKKPRDGVNMYNLWPKDDEDVYGVQDEDFGFYNKISKAPSSDDGGGKKVLYETKLEPGMNADTVSVATQKYYQYGLEGLPNFMIFVMVRTPGAAKGIGYFRYQRDLEYLID